MMAGGRWRACRLAAALLLLAGCGEKASPSVNSNTNWLLACSDPGDCDGDWDCLCGVCTATCSGDCQAEGGVCVAADSLAHGLRCEAGTDSVCLLGCEGDDECPAEEICVNGACSPRPPRTSCAEHAAALFCSDYEQADLAVDAATLIDGGELRQTTEHAVSGTGALAAAVASPDGRSRARYDFAPLTQGMLHLRAWLYLDAADISGAHVHTLTVGSVDMPMAGTNVHIGDGKLGLTHEGHGDVAGAVNVPPRAWFCVRVEIALGVQDGSSRVWLNDEPSAEVTAVDTLPPDGAHNLAVGIDQSELAGMRVLVDDVVLDTVPVGCEDP